MASSSPILEDSTRALLDSVSRLDALQDPESDEDEIASGHIYDDDISDTFGEPPNSAAEEARDKPTGRGLVIPQNYKTQLCRNWEKDKDCPYGKRCVFAHDLCELRTIQINLVAMAHVAWMRQGKDAYGRPGIVAGPPDPSLYSLTDPSSAQFWQVQPYAEFAHGPPGFYQPPAAELMWVEKDEKKKKKKEKKEKKEKKDKKHKKHKKHKKDKEGGSRENGVDGEKAEKKSKKHKKHKKHKKKEKKKEGDAHEASSDSDTDAQGPNQQPTTGPQQPPPPQA